MRRLQPPTSSSPLRDALADLRHGAPRRVSTDAVARFAGDLPPGTRVLEVGAGHYEHRGLFPRQELVTFDADPEQEPDVVGDAHALPFDDGSFGAALAISVLEHVANPYRVVEELARVTAPGGLVFAWVPFYFAVHGFPGDVTRFTDEGLRLCFEQAGFEVLHVDADPYAGLFLHLTDQVHFHFPRQHWRRSFRIANRVLFMLFRACYPLDRRYKVRTMYAGTELVGRRP